MSDSVLGIYTIGQTPRPDLVDNLTRMFGSSRLRMRGALDGLPNDQIPTCGAGGYPLATRLRDGTRVVVDAAIVEPLLQKLISEGDPRADAHLVLCAGAFPRLVARKPLIWTFDVAVDEFAARGLRSLEVLVPFAGQAAPAAHKWRAAGFSCRVSVFTPTEESSVADRLVERAPEDRAEALVVDYVGLPDEIIARVRATVDIPTFDLGHMAVRALRTALTAP
jgi:hypothetical protein